MRIERIGDAVLYNGDCLEVMRSLPASSVDAIVTDPPYHLTSIVKRFGGANAAPAKTKQTGAFARSSKGFMGQTWDGGDIAFRPETWEEALRVLKPGGHLAAFSGTRTYHRMAVAIEDAGFEIRDQLAWTYGSGFPKGGLDDEGRGKALKPAWEPIALARKPFKGTAAANIAKHGTGALNITSCLIPFADEADERKSKAKNQHGDFASGPMTNVVYGKFKKDRENYNPVGRFPANLMHDGEAGFGEQGRFFYCAKASKADRGEGNNHPTVKPTELMRWLCRLITPPGGLVLDPFTGSGSTGRGAVLEGFRFVGAELSSDFVDIAMRRIASAAGENDNARIAPALAGADLFSRQAA